MRNVNACSSEVFEREVHGNKNYNKSRKWQLGLLSLFTDSDIKYNITQVS